MRDIAKFLSCRLPATARRAALMTAAAGVAMLLALGGPARAQTALSDVPLYTNINVPGNVSLVMSVEHPTALSIANARVNYVAATIYNGYFDVAKCYQYVYVKNVQKKSNKLSGVNTNGSYFNPAALAKTTDHSCANAATSKLWSGNWLNWAAMQTIDPFRWVLTGGHRSVDAPAVTILEKSWHPSNQDIDTDNSPNQSTSTSTSAAVTPFDGWGTVQTRVQGLGQYLCVTKTGNLDNATYSLNDAQVGTFGVIGGGAAEYDPSTSPGPGSLTCVEVRVLACATGSGLVQESNCTAYGANAKPEGLIQQYATRMRFAAFGYLFDNYIKRDGGVMRARMKFVGDPANNTFAEWNSDGTFKRNPDPQDTLDTLAACSAAGEACDNATKGYSGVVNYLNNFGQHARQLGLTTGYKSKDPVSELYYAALSYFKGPASNGGGNVANYTSLTLPGSDCVGGVNQCVDGFPVITKWYPTTGASAYSSSDAILYSCQRNFVIGIGDVNTWSDANLPGTSLHASAPNEPAIPPEVSSDNTIALTAPGPGTGVTASLNWIGAKEGLGALGTTFSNAGRGTTNYIAALAYDAHVNDIRPDLAGSQTVSTYWMDVLEYGAYATDHAQNQYWLATKWGGFTVPDGYKPYVDNITTAQWWANQNYNNYLGTNYVVPDNYFPVSDGSTMVDGLRAAFASIASKLIETTTAVSLPSPQVSSAGNVSYSASYNIQYSTGNVRGSTLDYDSQGNPTLTPIWDGQALLDTKAGRTVNCVAPGTGWDTTRVVASWSRAAAQGVPFRVASLDSGYVTNLAIASASATQVLNFLRGDCSGEGSLFRSRSHLLGDIVNAKVVPVGRPSSPLSTLKNVGYGVFQTTWAARATVVYVAANDGMLHAFNGSSGTGGGNELWAYVPSALYAGPTAPGTDGLAALTKKDFTHHYYVNATPVVTDVDFGYACGSAVAGGCVAGTADWRTILVGGLGKGGKSFYAIDVTNPAAMTTETAVAGKVLWEFTDSKMGFSFGPAAVLKTRKYGWVVVLTSGYNNADGHSYTFLVNPKTGALLETVTVDNSVGTVANPSGLSDTQAFVPDYGDGTADALYAGDLLGNLWRFDLTSAGATSYPVPVKLVTAKDGSAAAQPITTAPLIEIAANSSKRYVLFGTGKSLGAGDLATTQINTLYSVWDGASTFGGFLTAATLPGGTTYPITRSQLNQNASLLTGIGASPTSPMGFYFDLGRGTNGIAEQVDIDPIANNGIVAFAANLSSGDVCSPSGTGRVIALAVATGKSALVDSSGNVTTSFSVAPGRVIDMTFVNVDGKGLYLTVGTSQNGNGQFGQGGQTGQGGQDGQNGGSAVNVPGVFSSDGSVTKLNWREVKGGN